MVDSKFDLSDVKNTIDVELSRKTIGKVFLTKHN